LLPLVYSELRRLAAQQISQESPGQTLNATSLLQEAYLRLVDVDGADRWNSPPPFHRGGCPSHAPHPGGTRTCSPQLKEGRRARDDVGKWLQY
jgi:hypothetical protein